MTKLVHFQIVDGTTEEFQAMGKALNSLKKKLDFDVEFLITDDRVELRDVKTLLKELYELYKKTKELREKKEENED